MTQWPGQHKPSTNDPGGLVKQKNSGPVNLTEFRAWSATPGVALTIGDVNEVVHWCNAAFAEAFAKTPEQIIGLRFSDYLPAHVLDERRELWRPMRERGDRVEYDQFFTDRRVHTTCAPLHPEVMGENKFIFRFVPEHEPTNRDKLAATSIPSEFLILSPAELRVLHAFAQGWSREEMARRMYRSPHTIQVHLKNIYAKLDIHREVDLALRLGRSGLGGFSVAEWEKIVEANTKGPRQDDEPGPTPRQPTAGA